MKTERRDGGVLKAVFLGFLVLGSVAIFLLGVMVGSNVRVPPEAVTGTAPGVPSPGRTSPVGGGESLTEEVELPRKGVEEMVTFPETLPDDARRELLPEPARPGQPPELPEAPVRVTELAEGTPPTVVTESPAGPAETPAEAAPAQKPRPEAPHFAAQVIATKDEVEARAAAATLEKAGFPAVVSARSTGKGRFFVVRTGRSTSETETRRVLAEVKRKTKFKDAFFTRD